MAAIEAFGLEVAGEHSTVATQTSEEEAWTGKWHTEQKEAWLNQIRDFQMWRQVRGLAGAVMCETFDFGIKWPQWRTLIFEVEVKIDMRYVCPIGVRKMLMQWARSVCWKKWAAKHEYEDLKEDIWLELALALLRKKTNEEWTEKHRNVVRKFFLEGGWVQKRLFDIGWSDERKCQACHKEKDTEKHRLHHCPERHEIRRSIPDAFRKWEQKARTSKKEWKWQRGIVTHPLSESQWNKGHFSMKKWESEKHKSWSMPAEGFKGHVATDGSLPGTAGKW